MPKIAPSSSPLWALKYAPLYVYILTKGKGEVGKCVVRVCLHSCQRMSLTTAIHNSPSLTADTIAAHIRLQSKEMTGDPVCSRCRVQCGWVTQLVSTECAQNECLQLLKAAPIQVMAHRKTQKIDNDSVGELKMPVVHISPDMSNMNYML